MAVVEDPLTLREELLRIGLLAATRFKFDGAIACVEERVAGMPRVPGIDQIQRFSAVLRILVDGRLLEVPTIVLEIHQARLLRPFGVRVLSTVVALSKRVYALISLPFKESHRSHLCISLLLDHIHLALLQYAVHGVIPRDQARVYFDSGTASFRCQTLFLIEELELALDSPIFIVGNRLQGLETLRRLVLIQKVQLGGVADLCGLIQAFDTRLDVNLDLLVARRVYAT